MTQYAVIGPGAVGTVIAHEISKVAAVKLFGRREQQVVLNSGSNDYKINVSSLLLNSDTFDVIFVAVKVTKLASILPALQAMSHDNTVIILCQNGMGQLDMLHEFNAVQAVVYISGQKTDDYVRHFQDKKLILPVNQELQRISQRLDATELELVVSPDYEAALWFKLLVNLGINTVTALTKNTAHVLELPEVMQLTEQLLQEGLRIARAEGLDFTAQTVQDIIAIYRSYAGDMGTSMYYDTLAGVLLEYDYIQGELQRLARKHQLTTPLLDVCCTLLTGYQYKR
ncbi:oxidoreductase [Macrococcus equipercicus]|uniref:2-dehydropantoate 2-reductase n=1 Tax=Macrococcus equipercicus TaxID=69967 RepID=A0A9Q9BV96_9STAP|nr:oxidoreductase [Macrococcus equipercicus]UTH14796.1 oxidoreductase [Macrococcus equipercicus]